MSRIGRLPIAIPAGVQVTMDDHNVTVKGPKGQLAQAFHPDITINMEDSTLVIERPDDEREHRALHGLTRALLANMIKGVTDGFEKILEIRGVGYRASIEGDKLVMLIGFSHPVEVTPREGIAFEVGLETNTRTPFVVVRGIDKQVVGQQAAEIRRVKPPEPYKGKGIRYKGEYVRRKAGKQGKAGAK